MCRPYSTFYPPLNIYSNNIVTISLIYSHCPLSLWEMITSVFFKWRKESLPSYHRCFFCVWANFYCLSTLVNLLMADPGLWFAINSRSLFKIMADPGLWFTTNSQSLFFVKQWFFPLSVQNWSNVYMKVIEG